MTSNREAPFWHLVFSSYKQFGGVHLWVKLYEKLETHNKGLGLFIFTNVKKFKFLPFVCILLGPGMKFSGTKGV